MGAIDTNDWKVAGNHSANADEVVRLSARLGRPVVDLSSFTDAELSQSIVTNCLSAVGSLPRGEVLQTCVNIVKALTFDGRVATVALGANSTLAFCGLRTDSGARLRLATLVPSAPDLARSLLSTALEAMQLELQATRLQRQLAASEEKIAQSFEEQCWLRDLARNMSISPDSANANMVAQGMLKPLVDLLRAEELFLLVRDDELTRSGLTSSEYGQQKVTLHEIAGLMPSLIQSQPTGPIVRNNQSLLDGRVRALAAVPILSYDRPLGYIVAVNRTGSSFSSGQSSESYSNIDVGLLEEASVLLSTQTHNIRLILDSQHLALGTLQAMSRAIDARDPYTRGHSERVARLSFELAEILGLEETACQEIYVAGILHDVGKIGVPDRVLLKAGALSDEEYDIIKQHPEIGYRIVEQLGKLHFTLPGVLYHHERWDGRGYPQGLSVMTFR